MTLEEWSDVIDKDLPIACRKCEHDLSQIRYAHERRRTVIHLTGVTNDADYYVAECPHCGAELARQEAGCQQHCWK